MGNVERKKRRNKLDLVSQLAASGKIFGELPVANKKASRMPIPLRLKDPNKSHAPFF